jgi:nicotinate dehydrogenase subunit A
MKGVRELNLNVNGRNHSIVTDASTALLYLLRNDLALNGPKYGCGLGECGACAVIVDGVAARSCVLPARQVEGRIIVTLEGLGLPDRPHPVQRAFIEEQAAQCGYCLNGMIMTVKALIDRRPDADEAEIRTELRHNLCRCGAHTEILRAAVLAVAFVRMERDSGR